MVRNAMRLELTALLAAPSYRTPAIRRSMKAEWLYATDYPVLCCGVPEKTAEALTGAGWEYIQDGNWLLLRKPSPEPPENWYAEKTFGPEARCCLSLLERHSARTEEAAETAQRILIKAGEEGGKAYEEACKTLHREWAARLRQGKQLPAVSRRYFGA